MMVRADPGDVMLDRFVVLRRWLRTLGVCWKCSSTLAFVQIEREGGAKGVKPVLECKRPERCRDRANAGRKSMPVDVITRRGDPPNRRETADGDERGGGRDLRPHPRAGAWQ